MRRTGCANCGGYRRALARRDFVQAEELRAEIAEVTACLDGVLESAQGA